MEKRTINTDEYIKQMLGDVDGAYTLSFDTLTLLLKTYGKELLLEAAERAKLVVVSNEEYREDDENPDILDEYECGSDVVIVYKKTISDILDEL